jgi:hypothetical protein
MSKKPIGVSSMMAAIALGAVVAGCATQTPGAPPAAQVALQAPSAAAAEPAPAAEAAAPKRQLMGLGLGDDWKRKLAALKGPQPGCPSCHDEQTTLFDPHARASTAGRKDDCEGCGGYDGRTNDCDGCGTTGAAGASGKKKALYGWVMGRKWW